MSEESMEEWEWNDDFIAQVEQLAVPSSTSTSIPNLVNNPFISYSPPRELSQRPLPPPPDYSNSFDLFSTAFVSDSNNSAPSTGNAKDLEIHSLKRELELVSKQRMELEHECFKLKKEKKEKEELIKLSSSKNDEKAANIHHSKGKNLIYGVPVTDHHEVSEQSKNAQFSADQAGLQINTASPSCKAIGVQVDLPSDFDLSEKLQAIWCSPSDQEFGKSLISKLFVDCSEEFHVLFGCMKINVSFKMMDSLAVENSDATLQKHTLSYLSLEAAKISHLYSMLTKIGCGMTKLEDLLEPLIDLCHLDNVVIVNKSLRILHVFLKRLLTLGSKAKKSALYSGIMSWSREFLQEITMEIFTEPIVQKVDWFT